MKLNEEQQAEYVEFVSFMNNRPEVVMVEEEPKLQLGSLYNSRTRCSPVYITVNGNIFIVRWWFAEGSSYATFSFPDKLTEPMSEFNMEQAAMALNPLRLPKLGVGCPDEIIIGTALTMSTNIMSMLPHELVHMYIFNLDMFPERSITPHNRIGAIDEVSMRQFKN